MTEHNTNNNWLHQPNGGFAPIDTLCSRCIINPFANILRRLFMSSPTSMPLTDPFVSFNFSIIVACISCSPHNSIVNEEMRSPESCRLNAEEFNEFKSGIGFRGNLPWHIPEDLRFFRKKTTKTNDPNKRNAVIMGRKTFESMNCKPLYKRFNICVTSTMSHLTSTNNNELAFVTSFEEALKLVKQRTDIEKTFVIGGEQIYKQAIKHPACNEIIVNDIRGLSIICDTFFPPIDKTKFVLYKTVFLTNNITTKYYRPKIACHGVATDGRNSMT